MGFVKEEKVNEIRALEGVLNKECVDVGGGEGL